jgi:hypothetical protein
MRTKIACCVAALATLLYPGRAHGGLLCDRSVVLPGATAAEVLDKCGEPSRRQSLGGRSGGRSTTRGRGGGGREVWVYVLGSRQLVRYLTFDHGRLAAIDFGGYGR